MKIYLADIFNEAVSVLRPDVSQFSCTLIQDVIYGYTKRNGARITTGEAGSVLEGVYVLLMELGVSVTSSMQMSNLNGVTTVEYKQGTRFMWMYLLELLALEQGWFVDTEHPSYGVQQGARRHDPHHARSVPVACP